MKNITLNGKTLGILTIITYGLAFLLGNSFVGGALRFLGLILLALTVVAFVREWNQRRKLKQQTEKQHNESM